jgi:predicted alpha/beta superfamily hydrolase
MHDGQNVFQDKDAIGGVSLGLEEYVEKNEIDVIIVAIDQVVEERKNEYCPWVSGEFVRELTGNSDSYGGKGKQYIEFIVHELKPTIDSNYRTISDNSSMAGISLGGLITMYAACKYPQLFRTIICISSSFWSNQEEIEKLIDESDLTLIESIYLDCGTNEAGEGTHLSEEFIESNQVIYNKLKDKILNTRFVVIQDAEHSYSFFKRRKRELFLSLQKSDK